MPQQDTLGTIWEVPDELWEIIEPIILEEDPPKPRGRKRADPRQMLNGIIFRLRSGCQWNRLPKELGDEKGGPLSIVVAGANVHDAKLLEATLSSVVVERPQPTEKKHQHLCLDKGYDNPSGRGAVARHGYRGHIRRIGEEKLDGSGNKRYPARR